MNGIDEIIARIEAESAGAEMSARSELEGKLKALRDARDAKIAETEAGAKKLSASECKVIRERAENRSATVRRDALLAAKRSLAETVFSRAAEAFATMNKERYIKIIGKMLAEAYSDESVGGAKTTLTVPEQAPATAEEISAAAGVSPDKTVKSKALSAGFILKTDTVELDCTPEKLIYSRKDALLPLVTATLFG